MFRLIDVLNSNTIKITPDWVWNGTVGSQVIINGIGLPQNISEPIRTIHERILQQRLHVLIQGFEIKLTNPVGVLLIGNQNALKCDVILNGVNIANYFPEYKQR